MARQIRSEILVNDRIFSPRRLLMAPWFLVLIVCVCLGSSHSIQAGDPASKKILLDKMPHVIKRPDFGGEACLAMALNALGHRYSQDDVFEIARVDPSLGRGCLATELKLAAELIGFEVGSPWINVPRGSSGKPTGKAIRQTIRHLERKEPVVFLMRQTAGEKVVEQFVLAVGIDRDSKTVIVHDPNSRQGRFRSFSQTQFENAIVLNSAEGGRYIFCMPLSAGSIKKISEDDKNKKSFTDADYAQHVRKLKAKLPSDDFNFVIEKPFVVIADASKDRVRAYATRTVRWCVEKLKQDYFKKDPKYILDIWLFKDKTSYDKYVEQLWGSKPHTPFGYYSSSDRVLVMNIGRGTGTLVHEIVHPFIESNFPGCPSWFNEGLASLYEQCGEKRGKIWGYTNWRLAGLQRAIRTDSVPTFKELCGTTRREFYQSDPGTNYSQARYLCYYLQENGLLRKYYHAFVKNVKDDKTGYETLKKILKTDDMTTFQKTWQAYITRLKYPN